MTHSQSVLAGKTIVVTRPRKQSQEMIRLISNLGAVPYLFPVIEVVTSRDLTRLRQAYEHLPTYDALLFTSANGVQIFFDQLEKQTSAQEFEQKKEELKALFMTAVGAKTAKLISEKGFHVPELPEEYRQEALAELLNKRLKPGSKVLFPRAQVVRPFLTEQLRESGIEVDEVIIYETRPVRDVDLSFFDQLEAGELDVLTLTSTSSVQQLSELFAEHVSVEQMERMLSKMTVASIGPLTTQAALNKGFSVHIQPHTYTIEALMGAIEVYFNNE